MPKVAQLCVLALLLLPPFAQLCAQEIAPPPASKDAVQKSLIVAAESKSDSVIAIPPITSVTIAVIKANKPPRAGAFDLPAWRDTEEAANGLQSGSLPPWHLLVSYDQFDEDGDNINSGVFEEYWAGPSKYKRSYKSDRFNQTDYGTSKGLFRQGDQQFPDRAQLRVRSAIVEPFAYPPTFQGFHRRNVARTFSGFSLQCTLIETEEGSAAPEYCFETGGSVLRYSEGENWLQTVYNGTFSFQGRNLAREVEVTNGGKAYLKLRIEQIELLSPIDDALFTPPANAVGPVGDRISGVTPQPINVSFQPKWPASLHGTVTVAAEIVIGKDGHVISARAVSGPAEAYKACEDAARKWIFKPYLVAGKPVEVEQKVEFSYHSR
jgi:Gram-negative bacterial TonB protein C-terminal